MKRWHLAPVVVGLLIVLALLATGCNIPRIATGPTETETQTVVMDDAESVTAAIRMGIGKLTVNPGSNNLLDATFRYNVAAWKPIVTYSAGNLEVRMPDVEGVEGIPSTNIVYEWDLLLNDEVPMDLKVDLGVGESNLKLGGLNLTRLEISSGVGESNIDLTGKWQQSAAVTVNGGIGSMALRIPNDIGVRLEVQQGLGNVTVTGLTRNDNVYTNESYNSAPVKLDIQMSAGIGQIDVTTAGE